MAAYGQLLISSPFSYTSISIANPYASPCR